MAGKLTATGIRNLTTPGKYGDGNGLTLIVAESGTKRWMQRITIHGKRRDIGLGSLSDVGLAEARELAAVNRKAARAGQDPLQARREAKAVLTFAEAAQEVHRLNLPTWHSEKHGKEFLATLRAYVFPALGHKRVSEITSGDVLAVLSPIWVERNATASRLRQRIGAVMKWAIANGWRSDNPAGDAIGQALPKVRRQPTPRVALPYDQVHDFIEAVRQSGAGWTTKLGLEFLVLTAVRSGEVRSAPWSEIDLVGKTWNIPAARMKSKRPHRVPLSPRAMEVLEIARALTGGEGLIFPGRAGRPPSAAGWSNFVREKGFAASPHGFRTSFRTWAQEKTTFPREIAEAALAHVSGDAVERAYARSDLFEKRRRMMDAWAAYLANDPSSAKVLRIA